MSIDWADLRLFLDVARLGGLSAATTTTGLSAATLGRRVTALEKQVGEPLFQRSHSGYALTHAGEELLRRAEDVEAAMTSLTRWRDGTLGDRVVRISAGSWTTEFLARHIGEIWHVSDPFRIEFVTAYDKVDIGRRNADIGVRSERPIEPNLAGRLTGKVAHAIYSGRQLINGVEAGLFVGVTGEAANVKMARWMMAHHGDRIGVRGNDSHSVRELVAAGAGLTVLPCFAGDSDPRLVRVAPPIPDLMSEQWLVSHQDERHSREVRTLLERLAGLFKTHAPLFTGEGRNRP
ncbi:MAG: LysR family transcriptional regulator [Devosia nanyangense]|uniref:LysR family transcriptional regulator n=1 Tax=Devosia nanyangense TaxID=1228055 RepID=A0A933L4X4_9HYPH|nr:LysR family transcriptional regulator [Devosia nanyangense]